jgi:branched-subunit amino acid permease
MFSSLPLSIKGLDYVAKLTGGPITYIGYPILIALTFCNLAYKLWGFKYVKTPVALVGLVSALSYILI